MLGPAPCLSRLAFISCTSRPASSTAPLRGDGEATPAPSLRRVKLHFETGTISMIASIIDRTGSDAGNPLNDIPAFRCRRCRFLQQPGVAVSWLSAGNAPHDAILSEPYRR